MIGVHDGLYTPPSGVDVSACTRVVAFPKVRPLAGSRFISKTIRLRCRDGKKSTSRRSRGRVVEAGKSTQQDQPTEEASKREEKFEEECGQ